MSKRRSTTSSKITHTDIRMYRLGTGDCFVLKFFAGEQEKFKMMIDAGVWQGSKSRLTPYIKDLKKYVDNHIDLLVITHEHQDHVLAFQRCKDLFTNDFTVDQIWMAWTEEDGDAMVEEWKKEYGQKKRALALASGKLSKAIKSKAFKAQFSGSKDGQQLLGTRANYANALAIFSDLHVDEPLAANAKKYTGSLKGMKIVKEDIANDNIRYLHPGEIIENLGQAAGIKFYVLGPPKLYDQVKKEKGGAGETYDHNKELEENNAFAAAVLALDDPLPFDAIPFDRACVLDAAKTSSSNTTNQDDLPETVKQYHNQKQSWRKIDFDWMFSAGSLALRMNSLTNNLSLALAIEFEESGKVMLFPGDAEYGSWASWHNIAWEEPSRKECQENLTTEELLNRTVFYKVAHHLSHNGTARRLGLDMMSHKDLTAMATLDYDQISSHWKGTMPNRGIIEDLLAKTKGRLLIMNEKDLMHGTNKMTDSVKMARQRMSEKAIEDFNDCCDTTNKKYIEFRVNG